MIRTLCRVEPIKRWIDRRVQDKPVRRVIRTRDGIKMHLDTSEFMPRVIYLYGDWDAEVGAVLRERLKPGGVFVDAGANIGFFSLLAKKLVGRDGRVVAFEPNPEVADSLRRNAELNDFDIAILEQGLFDRPGDGMLFIPSSKNNGAASLKPGGQGGFTVPLTRLDDALDRLEIQHVDLLKIDIEGAEVQALRGAEKLLSGPDAPPVVCEVSEYGLTQMGSSKDELYDLMQGHGYTPTTISPVRRSNVSTDKAFYQYDALFTKLGT